MIKYIHEARPNMFILENVMGFLTTQDGHMFDTIMQTLQNITTTQGEPSYFCDCRALNAADFGIPQHRNRLYIVGVARDSGIAPVMPWQDQGDVEDNGIE